MGSQPLPQLHVVHGKVQKNVFVNKCKNKWTHTKTNTKTREKINERPKKLCLKKYKTEINKWYKKII